MSKNSSTLEEAILKAVKVMEDVANTTKDIDSFKKLTIGFNKVKNILEIGDTNVKSK